MVIGRRSFSEIVKNGAREVDGDRRLRHRRDGGQTRERALELADVRIDVRGQVDRDVARQVEALDLGLLLEDRDPRLHVRRLDVGDQSPLEAISQPFLETGDVLRNLVRGQHDLAARFVERVEGVKELLLGALAVGEELHVVEDEHVDLAEGALELLHPITANRGDQLRHEGLGAEIRDAALRLAVQRLVADRVREMRLAEADAAVEEEWVVVLARLRGDGLAGGVSELVAARRRRTSRRCTAARVSRSASRGAEAHSPRRERARPARPRPLRHRRATGVRPRETRPRARPDGACASTPPRWHPMRRDGSPRRPPPRAAAIERRRRMPTHRASCAGSRRRAPKRAREKPRPERAGSSLPQRRRRHVVSSTSEKRPRVKSRGMCRPFDVGTQDESRIRSVR